MKDFIFFFEDQRKRIGSRARAERGQSVALSTGGGFAMPIIPEKHLLSQLGHLLGAQAIRGHDETSPCSLGAVARRAPGEASPLPQKLPSGISRSEQLLGLQRYLNFPFVPAYAGEDGGLVLDRVVHTLGSRGSSWWATITARLRAQRAWLQQKAGRSRKNSLLDPTNYALSVQTNSRVSNSLSLCANLDFDDFNQVVALANGRESEVPLRMQAELKQKLPWHQLTAEAILHGRYRGTGLGTIQVPRVLSADLASDSRKSGLRYQAGLFQVVSNDEGYGQDAGEGPAGLRTSTFLQCAATVEKDLVLWRGRKGREGGRPGGKVLSPFELAYSTSKFGSEVNKLRLMSRTGASGPAPKPSEKPASPPKRRMPFSALLNTPYLSFGGVAGVLAQADLGALGDASASDVLSKVGRGLLSPGDGKFWATRRAFASAGLNAQLGTFSKHILDFTSVSLKLDTGVTFPGGSGETAAPESGAFRHGLLDQYGRSRHMLSASVAQQVFGPLRVRADARCEVELRAPPQGVPLLDKIAGCAGLPPGAQVPEVVYGMDCQLPYLNGAARFSVWYSPTRREGLGEIRLL